jgi:hypothetical protein
MTRALVLYCTVVEGPVYGSTWQFTMVKDALKEGEGLARGGSFSVS